MYTGSMHDNISSWNLHRRKWENRIKPFYNCKFLILVKIPELLEDSHTTISWKMCVDIGMGCKKFVDSYNLLSLKVSPAVGCTPDMKCLDLAWHQPYLPSLLSLHLETKAHVSLLWHSSLNHHLLNLLLSQKINVVIYL